MRITRNRVVLMSFLVLLAGSGRAEKSSAVETLRSELHIDAASAEKSAAALAELGASAAPAIPDLVDALHYDEESVYTRVREALLKIGPAAIPPLVKSLDDSNFFVRRRSAQILGQFGPQARRAASHLVPLLSDPTFEVQTAASSALIHMGASAIGPLTDGLEKGDDTERKSILKVLAQFGPSALPAVSTLLKKDENVVIRAMAAEALGGIRPVEPEAVTALIGAMADLDDGVRAAAVDALSQMADGAKVAMGPLIVASHNDKDSLVRQRAMKAVENIGPATKDSLPGLMGPINKESPEVRRDLLAALGASTISFKEAAPVFINELKDPDPETRLRSVQAAGRLGQSTGEAVPVLSLALSDPLPEVRSAAVAALGQMKKETSEAAAQLQQALHDPNPVLRHQIILALGNLGLAGVPALIQELSDTYAQLSTEAAQAIVKIGPDARPALEAAVTGPDPMINKKVRDILKRLHRKRSKSS